MSNATIGLAGRFTFTVHGGKRGRVKLAEFDNMILDAGLEYVVSGGTSAVNFCQLGTGTTAVAANQTALANKIAHSSTYSRNWSTGAGTYVAGPPAYKSDYRTYRFDAGTATGNLTEVGVGWAATGSLFSRALIVDGGGAPTTITVLSDETLDVTYTLRVYAPADVTGSIVLAGTTYNYTLRGAYMASGGQGTWSPVDLLLYGFANATSTPTWVHTGSISATPGGTPSGTSSQSNCACTVAGYVGGTYRRDVQLRVDLNQGNIGGGIKSMVFYVSGNNGGFGSHSYQVEFSPNIPKDATKILRLNFGFSLARAP